MTADTATAGCERKHTWPPGFRFHPTDEELVLYYLKRKICRKRLKLDIVGETDVYKWDPEELPGQSKLKSEDRQWFFFSPRDRRYPNGTRGNRATLHGYWKATGKDRTIICNARTVGVKKTLVYYTGRAPSGGRTDWVMHEYTLHEEELKRCQTAGDYYVLYKVYKKSGPGPKNGEQYGAPFKEEEWADDEFLDVESYFLDQDHTSKIFNEIVSTDKLKVSNQIQSPIIDIDEILNKNVDDPAGPQLPNTDPALALTQVYDELPRADISFNDTNISERSILLHPNSQQYGVDYSFDLTKSTTQFIDTREVASTPNIFEQDFIFTGDDFIEMDDLIGQEPTLEIPSKDLENLQSNEIDGLNKFDQFNDASMLQSGIGSIYQETVSNADMNSFESYMRNQYQLPGGTGQLQNDNQIDDFIGQDATLENPSNDIENLQFDEINGLSEFDPFSDASMLLSGIDSIDEGTVSNADMNSFESYMWNQPDNQLPGGTGQLHSQLWSDNLKGDFLNQEELNTGAISLRNSGGAVNQNNSANISAGANQNQTVLADDDDQNWFTSTLWAFVESIPTTPADACESALVVNRAFERMSTFSRVKVNAATTSSKVPGQKASNNRVFFLVSFLVNNRVFFLVSFLVVLFAIFWVLMNGKKALFSGRYISL